VNKEVLAHWGLLGQKKIIIIIIIIVVVVVGSRTTKCLA